MSTTFKGQCSRCNRFEELYWIRKWLVCRHCMDVGREDVKVATPGFYRSADTFTIGITCHDCPEPDNLVHSICIAGMDLVETLQVGHTQYVAWVNHRRAVHGEAV